jgi:hypothetical protein
MLREDLSGRFDYLFEPLDADKTAGDGRNEDPEPSAVDEDEGRWSRRIVLAGIVLATLAAAAATVVALLQPAQPAPQVVTPTDATPSSTPMSTATSPAMPSPIPPPVAPPVAVLPATVSTSVVRAPTATPTLQQPQAPARQPTTVASEPSATMPPPPTTRAPISVSPETRTPFPNQTPPRSNDGSGGLLGGLF